MRYIRDVQENIVWGWIRARSGTLPVEMYDPTDEQRMKMIEDMNKEIWAKYWDKS